MYVYYHLCIFVSKMNKKYYYIFFKKKQVKKHENMKRKTLLNDAHFDGLIDKT